MIPRYTLPEMGSLWTDHAKYSHWLDVEIAVCRAMAEKGMIPQKSLQTIVKKASFDVDRINEIEATTNHDVISFLTSVAEFVGPDARYIHYGMTSSDMLDTALSLQMKKAAKLIDKRITTALGKIKRLAMKYKMTPMIGRTHGVHAEPMTLGLKFALWYDELKRGRERFKIATDNISVGAISGSVGNFANIDPAIEARACKLLGLKVEKISSQVIQRDRHAEYICALALLCTTLEKFGLEIRSLHRTEIGEVMEGFAKGQKGSSSMPHKKNPIACERLAGLGRLVRGNAIVAMENMPLWNERDISHSSAERVIIPDSTITADYALNLFNGILDRLAIDKKRMMENVYYKGGIAFSQVLLLKLTTAVGNRDQAYLIVQRTAMAAHRGEGGFKDILLKDAEVRKYLTEEEIIAIFDLDYYLKNVDKIFKRVFAK